MGDLDTLRPEVRDAINRQDRQEKCDEYCPLCKDRATIRAELLRLATIEADALIALDCEHDWQVEHKRAEKAEAELAALKTRIADAPTTVATSYFGTWCKITEDGLPDEWDGKRVRLVVEE